MLRRISLFASPLNHGFIRHNHSGSSRHLELQDKLSKQVESLKHTNERAFSTPEIKNEKGLEHIAMIFKAEAASNARKKEQILREMHETVLDIRNECASKPSVVLLSDPQCKR